MFVWEMIRLYRAKLCMGLSAQFGILDVEQIRMLKEIGFDGFFSGWHPGYDVGELRRVADETGMIFQSIHAPFVKMADMWEQTDVTETAVAELIDCLRDCARYDVPIMVTHAFIGFEKHEPTKFGLENFARVVAEAERLGVKVAFENTEGEEYLAALMERFKDSEAVGFCWDTGHEMCYNHSKDMLALYGDKLLCTHLNDNLGIRDFAGKITYIDDLHLLPFDGIADWTGIAARLNRHGFNEMLTFELNTTSKPGRCENDGYARMEIREYFTEVYKRACRVATLKIAGTK